MRGRCFICGAEGDCPHREDGLPHPQETNKPKPVIFTKPPRPRRERSLRERARYYLSRAVKRGDIRKPLSCERCGITPKRLHGHHWDYRKPLAVTWLCALCHGFVDKLIGSRAGDPVEIFARVDLDRIRTLLQTEFQAFGYDEVPIEQRLGKFSEISTRTTNTGLRGVLDGPIQ